ncbi:5-formyltetrahydrofolate cyclo-ligase [Cohnella cellulosilytica]
MPFMENRDAGALKAEWRKRMADVRDGLPAQERERLSRKLCEQLENEALGPLRRRLGRPLNLCAYAPYRSEASPLPLVFACLGRGDRVFAPRMKPDGEGLELREIGDPSDWSPGRWGVPEPDPGRTSLMEAATPLDVVLVPGMAYNAAGGRLGYGGGFYDRLYAERRPQGGTLWIGFAFSAQVVQDALPSEAHDLKLDGLATDKGLTWFAGREA